MVHCDDQTTASMARALVRAKTSLGKKSVTAKDLGMEKQAGSANPVKKKVLKRNPSEASSSGSNTRAAPLSRLAGSPKTNSRNKQEKKDKADQAAKKAAQEIINLDDDGSGDEKPDKPGDPNGKTFVKACQNKFVDCQQFLQSGIKDAKSLSTIDEDMLLNLIKSTEAARTLAAGC